MRWCALLIGTLALSAPAAEDDLAAKAAKGDAEAQYQLGRKYAAGAGVAKDEAVALQWFLKAGAADHAAAQVNLGSIYSHGFGVKQDWAESIRWFRRAALAGDRIAQHNLGLDFTHGHGVARDPAEAALWLRLAADQGQPRAQYNLGELYEAGSGVPKSDLDAHVLYTLASRHAEQVRIFGEAKAKEVIAKRDRIAGRSSAEQFAESARRVAAAEALSAVHPRRFGTSGAVEKTRGWYIWKSYDPQTRVAEIAIEQTGETFRSRVLPWATTYRRLVYGGPPSDLAAGERVNVFFAPDENHRRGYVVHFQDEIGQMKGHGHAWKISKVEPGSFSAAVYAGDKPLDPREHAFGFDPKCRFLKAGKAVDAFAFAAGESIYLTWAMRDGKRVVLLATDAAGLDVLKAEEADASAKRLAVEGLLGQVQSLDADSVHVLVFGVHWQQAGQFKNKQTVRIATADDRLRPTAESVEAEITFRKNRGVYGSGPSDLVLKLKNPGDAARVRAWADGRIVRLVP